MKGPITKYYHHIFLTEIEKKSINNSKERKVEFTWKERIPLKLEVKPIKTKLFFTKVQPATVYAYNLVSIFLFVTFVK